MSVFFSLYHCVGEACPAPRLSAVTDGAGLMMRENDTTVARQMR